VIRKHLYLTTNTENGTYATAHGNFVSSGVPVAEHEAWHLGPPPHGPGGTQGPGSGIDFLLWHRYYIRKLEDYLGSNGVHHHVPIPYWPSEMQVPAEVTAGMNNTNPRVPTPTWATVQGGLTAAPLFGHTALPQFRTSDELGRAIPGYHGSVHGTLGGIMGGFASPQAPLFYMWHGYIDHIWEEWRRHAMALSTAIVRGNAGSPDASKILINLFMRGADRKLWERYWNGSAWSWVDTGREVAGRAAMIVRGNEASVSGSDVRINLFVQGLDGRLWERYWNGSSWSWIDTGRLVDGEPLILVRGNRGSVDGADIRINLFVRGADGRLWERYWDGSSWSWVDTGRLVAGNPVATVRGDVEDVAADDLRINLFVRGADTRLWERYWNGSSWTWADTGRTVADDPVIIARGSLGSPSAAGVRINLFVKGLDGKLLERSWNGSAWSWTDTGQGIAGRPAVLMRGNAASVSGGDIRINLFAQGTDGRLWERYWNGATWSWIDTGMTADGAPLVIAHGNLGSVDGADIRIHVFNRVPEYIPSHPHFRVRLWERYWNGSAWSWTDTGRTVAGDPTAIVRGDVEDAGADDLRVNLFVAGDDGRLWERYWDGSTWSWVDAGQAVPF
jgi:hypothetical protein